jgi:5'-nucleotidase
MKSSPRLVASLLAAFAACSASAEELTILHVGDQETWLLSAQGNLRDATTAIQTTSPTTQNLALYGGIDRLATRLEQLRATNDAAANRTVLKLNAGDAILPGPRFNASLANLATAASDGGQDYYDAIAMRALAFDATVFGNHEFDFGLATAARFTDRAVTSSAKPYLSFNINFAANSAFAALQTAGKVAPYKVFNTEGGKQVAVIGVTTPLNLNITSPEIIPLMNGFQGVSTGNTEAQNLAALAANLQPVINGLRNGSLNSNEPVEVVIVVSHLQNYAREILDFVPALRGVDLVVSGGGHELTHVSSSTPGSSTIPDTIGPVLGSLTYPTIALDADNKEVPVVTANFGNRYIGEITLDLDDTTGAVTGILAARVNRVSGRSADSDAVVGDAALFADVITPVRAYIAALNTTVLATTQVNLNGERGTAGTARSFTTGVRNAETNLGNLVADALRHSADADVAIQNGGGVRATIAGPNISNGDTFNTLTFLNLVVRADGVTATQLKGVLEHGFASSTTTGSAQGRYPQLSGVEVVYDTTRAANDRVRRVVLTRNPATTADDLVLVDYGRVLNNLTSFSVASIDFLANGGDGYPFSANGFFFAYPTITRNYQEALADYLTLNSTRGGLAALGGTVTTARYPVVNAFARGARRSLDMIYAGNLNDTLTGTVGADLIQGGSGTDTIATGTGADTLIYTHVRDAGDRVSDFTPGTDKIDFSAIFAAAGVTPLLGTHVVFAPVTGGVSVRIVLNGRRTPMLTVLGVTAVQLNNPANFIL